MKDRVLILTTVSGFLPQFLKGHVEILKEMGREVLYASNFEYPAYEFDMEYFEKQGIRAFSIPIQRSPYQIKKNLRALKLLVKLIEDERIDVLHCHNPVGGILGRLAGLLARRRVRVIYTAHGFHFYRGASVKNWLLYYPVERLMARLTDDLATINEEDYERAKGFRLKKGGRVHKLSGVGVEEERYGHRPKLYREVREELGVYGSEICLMTSALLHPDKNYEVVLHALSELRELPLRYFICGEGPFGGKLRELVKKLGLEKRVTFLGFRRDMERLLCGADLFLFPSKREGLGMAALEALFCGVPVIAADNRGTREYLDHGENGFLLKAEDVEGFREAIRLLAKKRDLREEMGKKALEGVSPFGRSAVKGQIREMYQKALSPLLEGEERRMRYGKGESERYYECLQPEEPDVFGAFCPLHIEPDPE